MRVVIVGAGIMGLTTAWSLTKRGHAVTLLERGPAVPNPLSASGDQHRMIRRAYGPKNGYAALIGEAYAVWDELWADLGTSHLAAVGILCVCQTPGDEADGYRQGFDEAGTPYERMNPREAAARYRFLDARGFDYAFFTPEGGALLCRPIAAGLAGWLDRHGATLRTGAEVTRLDAERGLVHLASGETFEADLVVTTAGAWTLRLLPHLAQTLTTYRTALAYVEPPADLAAAWAEAPAILSIGGESEGYVLPPIAGTGLKFGAGFMKRPTDDPDADRVGQIAEVERLVASFAPPIARIDAYRISEAVTCVYTYTADKTFFVERVGKVLAVSACSGHAYKFAAAVGRRVAGGAESGRTDTLMRWLRAED